MFSPFHDRSLRNSHNISLILVIRRRHGFVADFKSVVAISHNGNLSFQAEGPFASTIRATSRIDGWPARRSATGSTLHPAQPQDGIGPPIAGLTGRHRLRQKAILPGHHRSHFEGLTHATSRNLCCVRPVVSGGCPLCRTTREVSEPRLSSNVYSSCGRIG